MYLLSHVLVITHEKVCARNYSMLIFEIWELHSHSRANNEKITFMNTATKALNFYLLLEK